MSRGSRITRFCHLFLDGDDQYVFFTSLGYGSTSQAQLVLHVQTSELRVRKVSHLPLDQAATRIEDSEKVLFLLREQAAKQGVQPHISHLYSASDVPAASSTGRNSGLWSRVSYSKYYNGGTVGDLYNAYVDMAQAIPSTTIWRLMTQLVDAVHFMSTCGEGGGGVVHSDLHSENIFLHYDGAPGSGVPDFYLGDFGNAVHGSQADPSRYRADIKSLAFYLERWLLVCPAPADPSERDELWRYLYFVVRPALEDLTTTTTTTTAAYRQLPDDLKPVMELLRNAPAGGPAESLPAWLDHRAEYAGLPMFYTYEDECLDAVGVDGPWHVAKVSIGVHNKRHFTVLDVSTETYSSAGPRGNFADCLSSDTPSWVRSLDEAQDASISARRAEIGRQALGALTCKVWNR
ncbi:hypothetical protein DHEL01_v212581 [Diaporthe helianthi]|uniref:non-specific serine/threonine protein kinase n=1 Tax=Diaporthe helianthi TaxID=158607 RepID=A0A2P5HFI6_DIAHE|nr:hypothetical protein DHEL01_v212581 [Diaporthe helianthi]